MKRTLFIAVMALVLCALTFSFTGTRSKAARDCSTLTFQTESLPAFFVGQPANFQIEAVGGMPPYKFKITTGALPPDLDMSKDGLITGVPQFETQTVIFVRLKDSQGCDLTQAFDVQVLP